MENCSLYLSGGMGRLSWEEQSEWRKKVIDEIKNCDCEKSVSFFNPVDYYNFKEVRYRTEKEIMVFDLNGVRRSDILIVNYNDPDSIGTAMEVMAAYERKKPIIGINENGHKLHPWLVETATRMCSSLEEAIEHIVEFYLN